MSGSRSVFARDDTLFGACQGLGEDFGVSPNLLRAAFALGLFWSPFWAAAAYAGCLAVVVLSRWLAPPPLADAEADEAVPEDREEEALPLAA